MINNADFKKCVIANVNGNFIAGILLPVLNDERTNLSFRIFRELLNGNEYIVFDDIKYHNISYYMDEIERDRFARNLLSKNEKLGIIARAIKEEKCKYNERYEKIKYIMKRLDGFDSIDKPLYVEICCINDNYYPLIFVGSKSRLLEDDRRGLRAITFSYMNALNPTKEYSFKEPVNYITILEFDKNKLGLIEYNSEIITDQEFESIINEVITRKTKSLSLYKNY